MTTKTAFISAANFFIDFGQAAQVTFPNGEIDTLEGLAQTINQGEGVTLFPATVTDDELRDLGWSFMDGDGEDVPVSRVNDYFRIYNLLVYGANEPEDTELEWAKSVVVHFPSGETDSVAGMANGCDDGTGVELFTADYSQAEFSFIDADGEDVNYDDVNDYLRAYNLARYGAEDPRGDLEREMHADALGCAA